MRGVLVRVSRVLLRSCGGHIGMLCSLSFLLLCSDDKLRAAEHLFMT